MNNTILSIVREQHDALMQTEQAMCYWINLQEAIDPGSPITQLHHIELQQIRVNMKMVEDAYFAILEEAG